MLLKRAIKPNPRAMLSVVAGSGVLEIVAGVATNCTPPSLNGSPL
jgi:hypothetical protein